VRSTACTCIAHFVHCAAVEIRPLRKHFPKACNQSNGHIASTEPVAHQTANILIKCQRHKTKHARKFHPSLGGPVRAHQHDINSPAKSHGIKVAGRAKVKEQAINAEPTPPKLKNESRPFYDDERKHLFTIILVVERRLGLKLLCLSGGVRR